MSPRQLAAAIAILAAVTAPAAQRDAQSWTGILRDARRQPIAGAEIRVESGGHRETATTAKDGSFAFAALAPADYAITVAYRDVTAACPQPIHLPRDAAAKDAEAAAQSARAAAKATLAPTRNSDPTNVFVSWVLTIDPR